MSMQAFFKDFYLQETYNQCYLLVLSLTMSSHTLSVAKNLKNLKKSSVILLQKAKTLVSAFQFKKGQSSNPQVSNMNSHCIAG